MLSFQMQADDFATAPGVSADDVRATPAGLRLAIVPRAADAHSLALWRPSSSGLSDVSGNGRNMTLPYGGQLTPEGLLLSRAEQNGGLAAVDVSACDAVAVEFWLRMPAELPLPTSGTMFACGSTLSCSLQTVGGLRRLSAMSFEGEWWDASEASCPLPQLQPGRWLHVAVQWRRGIDLTIWINGQQAAAAPTVTSDYLLPGSSSFTLGRMQYGSYLGGEYDQIQISDVARFPAEQQLPQRYRSTGSFTSPAPAFDGVRPGGAWLAPLVQRDIPEESAVALELRAGEQLDAGGQVQSAWRPAAAPPYGRYAQWRATLTSGGGPCNIATPTVSAVTLSTSEAGYCVYRGCGRLAASIDYTTPVERVGPGLQSVEIADLAPGQVHWFGVRSISPEGLVSPTAEAETRLELDAAGLAVHPRPSAVAALEGGSFASVDDDGDAAGGGAVWLEWLAAEGAGEVEADIFRIYGGPGGGPIDYEIVLGEVAAQPDRQSYRWTGGTWNHGSEVLLAVRAETQAGGVDDSPATIAITVLAAPPRAPGWLEAEAVVGE